MAATPDNNRGAYIPLTSDELVISTDSVTSPMWSNNAPTLRAYVTSSAQVASAAAPYYISIYQTSSTDPTAEIQFDTVYCDAEGSGSKFLNPLVIGTSPTRTNYGQYRNLVLGDENANFIFGNYSSSYFYVINLERARYKQQILPGTWTLCLSGSTAAANDKLILTDDSIINNVAQFSDAGRYFNIISGSAGVVAQGYGGQADGWTPSSGSYGWLLPDVNLLILNGEALDGQIAEGGIDLSTSRSYDAYNIFGGNPNLLIDALQRGGLTPTAPTGFTLNSKEGLTSDFIFCRAKNSEYNYSANPSFISSSTGAILFDSFIENPTTYITTVGLYNQSQELLATAKLSRPLEKDFTKELLVRVKLDF
tara:strand:+ start:693 stop:1787 length:1095 start_codon:yes stop_codon:yes gene_type:complete